MQYIYHAVPENMQGTILYPLNKLEEKFPAIYKQHITKYSGREKIMEVKIPFINCLWNDVLHFTPIHPKLFLDEARKYREIGTKRFFEIDINQLNSKNLAIYTGGEPRNENFYQFDSQLLNDIIKIPQKTFGYYKEMHDLNKIFLLYAWAPHVLYRGNIDISTTNTIEV